MYKATPADTGSSTTSATSFAGRLRLALTDRVSTPLRALALILFVTLLTHLPTGFGSFVADDYMQWAMLKGSSTLHALEFEKANPAKPLAQGLLDGFHFFSDKVSSNDASNSHVANGETSTLNRYKAYGNLPWWSGDEISMVPLRPIAAFTHWIDYTVFGDKLWAHQLHSLLYFFVLAGLLLVLYRKFAAHSDSGFVNNSSTVLIVASLATLLTLVDFSLTRSFLWVVARNAYLACAIGIGSLLCFVRWRENGAIKWLIASLALFAAALLTAEAALAVAAYMGAYVLCLERRPLWRKAMILLPVVAVIIAWRIGYSQGGFGALNIAQYIDPGRSPAQFAANFLSVFPLIVFSQISGVDTLVIFVHPEHQWKLIALAWIITVLGVLIIMPLLRASAVNRFWFVGSVVAAIPGTALISAESRTMTFVSLGFFYLLANWLVRLYRRRDKWSSRWTFRVVASWHLVLPFLISSLLTSGLLGYSQLSSQYDSVKGAITQGKTGLVVVNPDASGMMYYLPFEWAFRQFAVPAHLSVLTTGLETSDVTRVSEREFLIEAPAGMPLTHNAPMRALDGKQSGFNSLYASLYTQSFFTTSAQKLNTGDVIHNADTRITILERNLVGPTRLRLEFIGEETPDQKVWQWYDWKNMHYERITAPAIGETRRFWGPFDQAQASTITTPRP